MDVRLPDGTVITNVPDGMTRAELTNKLVANGYAKSLGGTDYSAEAPSSSTVGRLAEGFGQGLSTLGRGLKQRLGMMSEEEVAQTRQTDEPLLKTTAGLVGSIAGQTAPAIAASFVPGGATLAGAAVTGAGSGALQPTVAGEDVGSNIAKGAAFGAGGHTLGKLIFAPIANRNAAPRQALIDLAQQKYNIPLPASVQTGNKPLAYVESQLAATPGGGKMADLLRESNEQYAKAVMAEAGAPGQLASQAALGAAHKGTQGAYAELWSRNLVKADDQLINELAAASDFAKRTLTPAKASVVEKQISNIISKVRPDDTIEGSIYQMFLRPELRTTIKGDSSLQEPLRQVKKALDAAAYRSLQGADIDAVKKLNYTYAVQKALQDKVGPAEARGGVFTPSAVQTAVGDMKGNIGELARIGPVLREPPQSGTAPRALVESMLRGAPMAGTGAAYGYYEGGSQGAVKGALAGLLGPVVASRLMANPAAQRYLARGLLSPSQGTEDLLRALLRGGAMGVPQAIEAIQNQEEEIDLKRTARPTSTIGLRG